MRLYILLFSLFFSSILAAQNATDLGLIIYQPTSSEQLTEAQQNKLSQRVLAVFTQHGVVNGRSTIFAVKSSFDVLENNTIEGMKAQQVVRAELTLTVVNSISGHIVNVMSKSLMGSGNTTTIAIQKSINNIRPQKAGFQSFIKNTTTKIADFYAAECTAILAEAKQANSRQNYAKAVAILHAIPRQNDCFSEAQTALDAAYLSYQKQQCQQHIQRATMAMTKREFSIALEELAMVDVESPCAQDAQNLLAKAATGVDEQLKAKHLFLYKVHTENLLLEKARIDALDGIGRAYLKTIEGQDIILK